MADLAERVINGNRRRTASSVGSTIARNVAAAARRSLSFVERPRLKVNTLDAAELGEQERLKRAESLREAGKNRKVVDWTHTMDVKPPAELRRASRLRRSPDMASPEEVGIACAAESFLSPTFVDMTLEERIATPPPKRSPKSSKPVPHQDLILENLPFEILYAIANHAGFFPTLKLMHTSRFFRTLFQSRSAWLSYMDPTACSDQIENMVLVQTKISLFDHVLFGVWNGTGEGKKAGVREEEVFFEHRAFNEEFDFLGGVSVGLGRSGFGRATFFEHRDTLPCYQNDLKERVRTGQIPPSIPPVTPVMTSISSPTSAHIPIPRGAKIEHSCSECAHFDHQKILKSICLLDHNHHPNLHALENAIAWDYTYPDGRRTLKYRILSHTGILGYGAARDLPMVHVNKVYINGVQLTGWAHDFYKRVVG